MNLITVAAALTFVVEAAVGGGRAAASSRGSAFAQSTTADASVEDAAPPLPALLTRIDGLHRRRDDNAAFAEEKLLVQAGLARAPNDYQVLWRAARFYFWASDDPGTPRDQRSRLGKDGWDLAERAIVANPHDVAGYYWAAVCMGSYALGLGPVKALAIGLEGKFRDRLGRAASLNDAYEAGGVEMAWGRFFDKLPWPKRDRGQAEAHLGRALQINPTALRARVFLATLYLETDRAAEAKRLLDEVAAAPVGRYDAPEERRAKAMAVGLLPELAAKLK